MGSDQHRVRTSPRLTGILSRRTVSAPLDGALSLGLGAVRLVLLVDVHGGNVVSVDGIVDVMLYKNYDNKMSL